MAFYGCGENRGLRSIRTSGISEFGENILWQFMDGVGMVNEITKETMNWT